MTRSLPNDNPRRADGPTLVAVHTLPDQVRPLRVTTVRPWAVAAPQMLLEADRALAADGRGLAVKLPANVLHNASLGQIGVRLAGDDHEAHGRYAAARFSAAICQCSTVLGTPIVIRSLWLTGAHLLAWLEYRTRGAGEE